jgi:hypothetical protein
VSDPEPTDLMVLIKIIEYLEQRNKNRQVSQVDQAAITNIINHLEPGAKLGLVLRTEMTATEETHMGDTYNISGQVAAAGREATADNTTMNQIRTGADVDLTALAAELDTLRQGMREQAKTVEEDQAIVEVGLAAAAAHRGDGDEVQSRLKAAGRWALGVATGIGTGVAAGAIKAALGL